MFGVEVGPVRVATEGVALGQTILKRKGYDYPVDHWDNISDSSVCMRVDAEAVMALYESTMTASN